MGGKKVKNVFVKPEVESVTQISNNSSARAFSVTLSDTQWAIIDVLSRRKILPSIDAIMNEAVCKYLRCLSIPVNREKNRLNGENSQKQKGENLCPQLIS